MIVCEKHQRQMVLVACPDKRPGCAVAHYGCPKCRQERVQATRERETLEALQQANGLTE